MSRRSLVLLSGGLDSTVALWWARNEYHRVTSLSFRYGSKEEGISLKCARIISERAGAANSTLEVDVLGRIAAGRSALVGKGVEIPRGKGEPDLAGTGAVWVPARNLVLISLAASYADSLEGDADIVVGFDEEEARTFPDNSRRFVDSINLALADAVFGKEVRLVAPLLDMDKGQIVRYSRELGAPVELSCSCYQPRGFKDGLPLHCGVCQSCLLRHRGFLRAGVPDPTSYEVVPP